MKSLAFFLALTFLCGAATAQEAPPVGAQAVREAAARSDRIRVVARLRAGGPEAGAAASRLQGRMAVAGAGEVRRLGRFPLVVLEVDRRQLDALLASGEVLSVQEDRPEPASLAESVPLIEGPKARAAGAGGKGQVVALLDSGVEAKHPMLLGKVTAQACFSTTDKDDKAISLCPNGAASQIGEGAGVNCPPSLPDCEHGTHTAGIAVGKGALVGVAPEARLVAIQVFSRFTGGPYCSFPPCVLTYPSDQVRALDHVLGLVEGGMRIAAVNMSLGGERFTAPCNNDIRKPAIDALRALGVATVIAAGNDGYDDAVATPGCISSAVTVGASTDYGKEAVATFSDISPLVDLLAPGDSIRSAVPGGGYRELAGTSMAAPHVAGAFAALRSALPDSGVDAIEAALKGTGRRLTDPGSRLALPRISLAKALTALKEQQAGKPGWHEWADLGGSLQGTPSCLESGAGLVCWGRTNANALAWNRFDGAKWSGWSGLGGTLAGDPACVRRGSRLDCFAIGPKGALQHLADDGTGWGAWESLGNALLRRPACLPAPDGQGLTCLALGTDKAVWQLTQGNGGWQPWASLGATAQDQPFCAGRDGGLDCWALGGKGAALYRRFAEGGWGKGWQSLPGSVAATPSCVGLACFSLSTGGKLVTASFKGGSWSSWKGLGGSAASAATCIATGTARTDCFLRTGSGTLAQRRQEKGKWQDWSDLGGKLAAAPACLTDSAQRIHCFALGSDKRLKHIAWY